MKFATYTLFSQVTLLAGSVWAAAAQPSNDSSLRGAQRKLNGRGAATSTCDPVSAKSLHLANLF